MQKVLVCGGAGFIGRHIVKKLINNNFEVVSLDNLSKYAYYDDLGCETIVDDAKNTELLKSLLTDCDHFIVCAAKIGGINYFHKYAYDLLAENERILASCFDAAIYAFKKCKLKKITVLSSSMIYESTTTFPSKEGDEYFIPPPISTYGFQKLCVHYFCRGANEQYDLPFTILVPFNAVGIGELKSVDGMMDSHVVPDFIRKAFKKQIPFEILGDGNQIRCFTYVDDLADGVVISLNHKNAINRSFNLANPQQTTILDLAKKIWYKINPNIDFAYVEKKPLLYDVKKRVPDVSLAKELLGFEAKTSIDDVLDIIIGWYEKVIEKGLL